MRARNVLPVVVWILLLSAVPLFASEEHAGQGAGIMEFLGKVFNFLVLFGGLAVLLFKPMRAFLRRRTEDVRRVMEETEAERKEAEKKYEEAARRLDRLASEVEAVKSAAEADGLAEQEKIRRLAAEEAEKIKRLAQADLEAQVRAGIKELKRHAAELAVRRAQEKIREKMTAERQAILIEQAIRDVAAKNEKEHPHPKIRPRVH